MTAQELFDRNLSVNSDIGGHMQELLRLGRLCRVIVEFGVRAGNSTSAWLLSKPAELHCYDQSVPGDVNLFYEVAASNTKFLFTTADTSSLDDIPDCDLLFMDTLHTEDQLKAEMKHARRVRKYMVFHDTEFNGWKGEGGQPGLRHALIDFLLDHPEWRIDCHYKHCNGLTVLRRTYTTLDGETNSRLGSGTDTYHENLV